MWVHRSRELEKSWRKWLRSISVSYVWIC